MPGAPKWEERLYYETMLGTYDGGAKPVVNLAVPNGTNSFTSHIANAIHFVMAGEGDSKVEFYEGTGMIAVPMEGKYAISIRGNLYIDENHLGRHEKEAPITVRLTKGLHRVRVREAYHLSSIVLQIWDIETREKLPVFNSLADIKSFLSTPLSGRAPVEASGWDPEKARPLRIDYRPRRSNWQESASQAGPTRLQVPHPLRHS